MSYFLTMDNPLVLMILASVAFGFLVGLGISRHLNTTGDGDDRADDAWIEAERARAAQLEAERETFAWRTLAVALQDQLSDQPTAVDIIQAVKELMIPPPLTTEVPNEPGVDWPAGDDDVDWSDQLIADQELDRKINAFTPPPEFLGGPVIVDDEMTGEDIDV